VTPDQVRTRLRELRAAGHELRKRPARDTLAALGRVLEAWRSADSPWRRKLEAELPAATGFSRENVREGLARGLARFGGEELLALVRDELGGAERLDSAGATMISGFETTAVVLAGSIPQPSLLSLLLPLVLRSPVLAKPASRDQLTPFRVAESLEAIDPELGRCLAVAAFGSRESACLDALLEADCVAATGSDASIAALAARVAPPRRFVPSGHRLSLAVLGPDALSGEALDAAAAGLALDTALWDQQGCLSPLAVYVVGGDAGAPERAAQALARELAALETKLPRGEIDAGAAARFLLECETAELRAAAGERVALLGGPTSRFAVVREADAAPRPAPLGRFLRVHPVADPAALVAALRPLASHLAGVALAGMGRAGEDVARALADLGASRLCRPGELQSPPLAWRHDNRPLLLPLARLTDRETPG
jgi:hypothetical protein